MTPQEIFTKGVSGVIAQGQLSRTGNKCRYRGSHNTKCVIGQLIPDQTAKAWDCRYSSSIGEILKFNRSKFIEPWMKENRALLELLQAAHDGAATMEQFTKNASAVAHKHHLEMVPL